MDRVRIFISSPGDVAEERQCALAVVQRLQEEFSDTLVLEPLLWEQEPLLATADFQSQIRSPADFDIFATILGGRLGSPLGLQFTRRDGSPYASGTEFEFEAAVAGYHASGKPELLFYRKLMPEEQAVTPQFEKVSAFFDKWFSGVEDRTMIGTYHAFTETTQFEKQFTVELRELLHRFLPRPNNLPAPISSFLGRLDLIREISGFIKHDDVRVVTLVGPMGVGKTRLALRTSRGLLPDFRDGVFLVTLASSGQTDLLPDTIASALGVESTDNRPIIDSLIEALQDKEMLLLIDNLVQTESAAEHINALVSNCPGVKLLLTSSEAFQMSQARTVAVPAFAVPDLDTASFAEIRDSESAQLFVERTKTVREDFELTEDNAREVLQICQRLKGLPFSIELATSRMRSMNTTKLLRSLESIKVKDESGKTIYLVPR